MHSRYFLAILKFSVKITVIRTVPLKCNVALVRDSHSRLDHSQSTIEGVTYEKRPRDKLVLESLNSRVTINSYSGV